MQLSTTAYSQILIHTLSELEQCRVKETCPRIDKTAQDSNLGSLSRESESLPTCQCFYATVGSLLTSWGVF